MSSKPNLIPNIMLRPYVDAYRAKGGTWIALAIAADVKNPDELSRALGYRKNFTCERRANGDKVCYTYVSKWIGEEKALRILSALGVDPVEVPPHIVEYVL